LIVNTCVETIERKLHMSIEDNIESISNAIDHLSDQLNNTNDFGNTIGDELHQIEYQISRVADALEKILKKMP